MRFHRLVKEVDGYGVSIGKSGNKMKEAVDVDQPGRIGPSGVGPSSTVNESYLSATGASPGVTAITGRGASLSQLTETLGRILGMPLWDQTGLKGKYDFAFRFSEELSADSQRMLHPFPPRYERALASPLRSSGVRLKPWLLTISTGHLRIDLAARRLKGAVVLSRLLNSFRDRAPGKRDDGFWRSHMIHSVRDLSPDQKGAVENLLGHAVSENEQISIRTLPASDAPDWLKSIQQDARQAGLDKMSMEEIEITAARRERNQRPGR